MQNLNELAIILSHSGRIAGRSLDVLWGRLLHHTGIGLLKAFARSRMQMDVAWHAPLLPGPKVLAANHPTTVDPFLLLTVIEEPLSMLVTNGVFQLPGVGPVLHREGHVPVVAGQGAQVVAQARKKLAAGRPVGVFSEGSLSPLDERGLSVGRARTGAARLALGSGVPVVPIGISLDWRRIRFFGIVLEDRPSIGRLILSGPYAVTVGEPMHFDGSVEDRARVRQVAQQINGRIAELSCESALRVWSALRGEPSGRCSRPATGPLSYGRELG